MKYSEKALDKLIDEIGKFMDSVPEEDRCYVATSICDEVIIDSTCNHLESMGFLECLKLDFQKEFNESCDEERKKKDLTIKN